MPFNTFVEFKAAAQKDITAYLTPEGRLDKRSHIKFARDLLVWVEQCNTNLQLISILYGAYANLYHCSDSERLLKILATLLATRLNVPQQKVNVFLAAHQREISKVRRAIFVFATVVLIAGTGGLIAPFLAWTAGRNNSESKHSPDTSRPMFSIGQYMDAKAEEQGRKDRGDLVLPIPEDEIDLSTVAAANDPIGIAVSQYVSSGMPRYSQKNGEESSDSKESKSLELELTHRSSTTAQTLELFSVTSAKDGDDVTAQRVIISPIKRDKVVTLRTVGPRYRYDNRHSTDRGKLQDRLTNPLPEMVDKKPKSKEASPLSLPRSLSARYQSDVRTPLLKNKQLPSSSSFSLNSSSSSSNPKQPRENPIHMQLWMSHEPVQPTSGSKKNEQMLWHIRSAGK